MESIRFLIAHLFGDSSNLALMILLLPLCSFLSLFFLANFLPRKGDLFATAFSGIAFVFALLLFLIIWGTEVVHSSFPWFQIPANGESMKFMASMVLNDNTTMMLLLVTLISFLVHLYSLEYMKGKKNYARYYPYLGLFTFSMIGIVLSDNLLITFMFWELVGFSSYLLIGFWYDKEAAIKAAKKAFIFNRIGDTGFIIGLIALFAAYGTFEFADIVVRIHTEGIENSQLLFWAGLGIFLGCIGKSAQFPLQAWLPDAMEGPTPVSALIHAATMVAAGIFLLVKVHLILHPDVLDIIAFIGAITAFAGALPALFQNDIKKVLAFSTISQLGFMTMAVGVGSFESSMFHLITHGFFKACLFLSAGAVIHAMHEMKHDLFWKGQYRDFDSQDMRLMGGFRKVLPVTFYAYLISAAALAGIPLFSVFLSKDAILEGALNWASANKGVYYLIPLLAFASVFVTAAYMTRQIIMVFFGENRLGDFYPQSKDLFSHLHDPSWLMKGPLIFLSICCFWFIFSPNPFDASNGWFFQMEGHWNVAIASILVSCAGIVIGYLVFKKVTVAFKDHVSAEKFQLSDVLKNNWHLDSAFYYLFVVPGIKTANILSLTDSKIVDGLVHFVAISHVVASHMVAWLDKVFVDGLVNLVANILSRIGGVVRSFQSGQIQLYFVFALIAVIILGIWIIIA